MSAWSPTSADRDLDVNIQSNFDSSMLFSNEKHQVLDSMDAYFECITTCSLDDGECITSCTEILREHN
jgi:hypothetical protein